MNDPTLTISEGLREGVAGRGKGDPLWWGLGARDGYLHLPYVSYSPTHKIILLNSSIRSLKTAIAPSACRDNDNRVITSPQFG